METFRAGVVYGDWEGTAAADEDVPRSISRYLKEKGLINPGESVIAVNLWVGENREEELGSVFAKVLLFTKSDEHQSVLEDLSETSDPIPVRVVDLDVTLEEFAKLFKRLDLILTLRGAKLDRRHYLEIEG